MNEPLPRVRLRPLILVLAVFLILLVLGLPLAIALTLLVFAPIVIGVPVALVILVIVSLVGYAMSSSVQWVELDDGVIRWKKLLTRRVYQKPLTELIDARPLHSNLMGPLENAIMDAMMMTSNRGFELRFRDGTKLGLVRGDMAGLDEFLGALAEQLRRVREGDPAG
jgi:hypothetical protein